MCARRFLTLVVLLLIVSGPALAVPPTLSISDTDADATITLWVLSQTILGDVETWCEVRIRDTGSGDVFTAGDQIFLWVYEDDGVGDDLLWSTSFSVSAAEVSANAVDRTFDCSGSFGDDVGSQAEYYTQARVEKEDTCGVCRWDRPETGVIDVAEVDDDGAEPDDTSGSARPLGLGTTSNRIARDQDWYTFELTGPVDLELEVLHDPAVGRVELTLFDAGGALVANATDLSDRSSVSENALAAGVYRARVAPRVSNNFNHYDIRLTVSPLATDCAPGALESEQCGNCGQRSRECNDLGRWTAFGSCTDQGECALGAETTESCGLCGTLVTTCSASCAWEVGSCAGEGVCEPEAVETDACGDAQVRTRSCDESCEWGEYTECGGSECEGGATEACYTGPAGARGVGACIEGERDCIGGLWAQCQGDVLPEAEDCDDPADNDCDGQPDSVDSSCVVTIGELGDPCVFDTECEDDLECLRSPAFPQFTDGYCGDSTCSRDIDCGPGGVCGQVFGETYCLKACDTSSQCRSEYACAGVGTSLACVPRCDRNSQCADPEFPICDSAVGICQALPAADPAPEPVADVGSDVAESEPDGGTGDAGDAGGDVGGDGVDDAPVEPTGAGACGCGAVGGELGGNGLLALLVAFVLWRRRGG